MRRMQVRTVVLIVVAAHVLSAVVVAWLLWQSDIGSAPSSSPPRERQRAAVAPTKAQLKPVVSTENPAIHRETFVPKELPVIHRETVVLPTLDTPIPAGKSAVWCASFQMVWDRLREDVDCEPIRLAGAEEVVERLNRNPFSVEAITPENVYVISGRCEDGIVKKIRSDMTRRFPEAKLSLMEEAAEGALAFAYLQSKVRFPVPFLNHPLGIEFQDSPGHSRRVSGFGFMVPRHRSRERTAPEEKPAKAGVRREEVWEQLQRQVKILYVGLSSNETPVTFAIDPCRESSPDQFVLARLERKATLAATLGDLEKAIASFSPDSENGSFIPGDQLSMPVLSLDVEHHFRELEGRERLFLNKRMRGTYLKTAIQTVRFKLDANGADLASTGRALRVKSDTRPAQHLIFDRPFLLYARKRGAKQPFLVMWIDNSGLMQPKKLPPQMDD
jgi:hypothetical protein